MKIRLFWLYLLLTVVKIAHSAPPGAKQRQEFEKDTFYKIVKDGTVSEIDRGLTLTAVLPASESHAYSGVLLMKKAGLLRKPKDKLDCFKAGRIQLETAIHAEPANIEFRFLRLIIQEHAPKITKYRDQLREDSEAVKKHFSGLPADVQLVVKDYSKHSPILNL